MKTWGLLAGALMGAAMAALMPGVHADAVLWMALFGWVLGMGLNRVIAREVEAQVKAQLQALELRLTQIQGQKQTESKEIHPRAATETIAIESPPPASTRAGPADFADTLPQPERPDPSPAPLDDAQMAPTPAGGRSPLPRLAGGLDAGARAVREWLLGGNTVVRVGLVMLFIGLSFLARYAAQAGLLPPALRLAAVGAAGFALLAFGFRQRLARPGFGLALQGAGVAVMYLTVFGAFRLYPLLPYGAAFGFLLTICAAGCVLALMQDARSLALLAFAGGYAAPLLLSEGGGNHVGLFGYFLLLDLGIVYLAWRRAWRELNLLGFLATFGIAAAWGWMNYRPADYGSTQGFLIAYVLVFVAAAVLYARHAPTNLHHVVDSALVFGTPLAGFGLQAALVRHFEFGQAFSALGFGAGYLLLAWLLQRRGSANLRLLVECFIALGVGFATLAIPLGLDARWTSGTWALEGAAAFWVGARQGRWMSRAFGLLLQAAAAAVFIDHAHATPVAAWPLAHPMFLGAARVGLPMMLTAWVARRPLPHSGSSLAQGYAQQIEPLLQRPWFVVGFAFWCVGWAMEADRLLPVTVVGVLPDPAWSPRAAVVLVLLAILASAGAALALARRLCWDVAAWPSRVALAIVFYALLVWWARGARVLDWPGWWAWPLALGLHWLYLWINETRAQGIEPSPAWRRWLDWQHPATAWVKYLLLADVLFWLIDYGQLWRTAWASAVLLLAALLVLVGITAWAGPAARAARGGGHRWPLAAHALDYLWAGALPVALLCVLGALTLAWTSPGNTPPLPYLPLLNPTDLTVGAALLAVLLWRRAVLAANPLPKGAGRLEGLPFWAVLGGVGLVAASTVWLRVAHHFLGVPWTAHDLFESFVVQTGYSILWSAIALALMVLAHRRAQRPAWLAGAGLLGLVVAKLLLVDMSNRGGAERIVAFIGVGVLMLAVGYFAPLPPKTPARPARAEPSSLSDRSP